MAILGMSLRNREVERLPVYVQFSTKKVYVVPRARPHARACVRVIKVSMQYKRKSGQMMANVLGIQRGKRLPVYV